MKNSFIILVLMTPLLMGATSGTPVGRGGRTLEKEGVPIISGGYDTHWRIRKKNFDNPGGLTYSYSLPPTNLTPGQIIHHYDFSLSKEGWGDVTRYVPLDELTKISELCATKKNMKVNIDVLPQTEEKTEWNEYWWKSVTKKNLYNIVRINLSVMGKPNDKTCTNEKRDRDWMRTCDHYGYDSAECKDESPYVTECDASGKKCTVREK